MPQEYTHNNGNNKHGADNKEVCILNSVKELGSHNYAIGKKLNSGSFSRVHQASHNGVDCAVKIINLGKATSNFIYKLLPREIVILKKLKHPNIIFLHDIFLIPPSLYIFMELANSGDLLDYIVAQGALAESKAKEWFKQIVDALHYCHKLGVAHRDIKCENLLIHRDSIKLTDFGFACIIYDTDTRRKLMSTTYCGSISYVPPEILLNVPYDATQSDIWSLGIVLYVMLDNQLPFESGNLSEIVKSQINNNWSFAEDKKNNMSEEAKELIRSMLNPNPISRPNITKIKEARWLREPRIDPRIHDYNEDDDDDDDEFNQIADKKRIPSSHASNKKYISKREGGKRLIKKTRTRTRTPRNIKGSKSRKQQLKQQQQQSVLKRHSKLGSESSSENSLIKQELRQQTQQVPESYKLMRQETEPFIPRRSPPERSSSSNYSTYSSEEEADGLES